MTLVRRGMLAGVALGGLFVATGAAGSSQIFASKKVLPLRATSAPVPRFKVAGYDTRGQFLQVANPHIDLRAVNRSLRGAVLKAQREYAPYARQDRRALHKPGGPRPLTRGLFGVRIDPALVSASDVVVSVLMPLTTEAYRQQKANERWLSATVVVPSGRIVEITDLFRSVQMGLRAVGRAWLSGLRKKGAGGCITAYPDTYLPTIRNYSSFALTPQGLVIGVDEGGNCGPWQAAVPYRSIRPYLSKLGASLVAGVRAAKS